MRQIWRTTIDEIAYFWESDPEELAHEQFGGTQSYVRGEPIRLVRMPLYSDWRVQRHNSDRMEWYDTDRTLLFSEIPPGVIRRYFRLANGVEYELFESLPLVAVATWDNMEPTQSEIYAIGGENGDGTLHACAIGDEDDDHEFCEWYSVRKSRVVGVLDSEVPQ